VSSLEIPPPDALTRQSEPFVGFGPTLPSQGIQWDFQKVVNEARHRVRDTFQVTDVAGRPGVEKIERVIGEMWDEGWSPEQGDTNLFTRDFGCLLMMCLTDALGGEQIFRSTTDLSHASIFWREQKLEAFPFHRVYKRLSNREGDSLVFFFDGLTAKVRPK
jgi:hypothetical protein